MKKALSFIMAAAMAFGLTTSVFAETTGNDTTVGAVAPSATVKLDLTSSAPSGGYSVWTEDDLVAPGSETRFDFSIEAYGNKVVAEDGTESNVELDRKYYDFTVKVTGPLEYERLRITQDAVNAPNEIHGSFYVTAGGLNLTAPKTGSIAVIAKANSEGRRKGFETVEFGPVEYSIGYGDANVDHLLAEIDDMHEYGETVLEFALDTPVISKEMMSVLKKELNSKDTVIFEYEGILFAIKGSEARKATPAAFNIAYNTNDVDAVVEAFNDAEFDAETSYLNFQSGAKLPMNAVVTVDSEFATPYVYQFDGSGFELIASTLDVDYDELTFTISDLGKFIITDQPIPADLQVLPEEPDEDDEPIVDEKPNDEIIVDDSNNNGTASNPDTGSSSVSMTVMLAVAALSAAGLIATRKSR